MLSLTKLNGHSVFCRLSKRFYRLKPSSSPSSSTLQNESVRQSIARRQLVPQVSAFIDGYRNHGYRIAQTNPLSNEHDDKTLVPELDPTSYSLNLQDKVNIPDGIIGVDLGKEVSVADLTQVLQDVYCGGIGAEFSHLSTVEKDWFAERMERRNELYTFSHDDAIRSVSLMKRALELNRFLSVKFATVKRYSGEGAESMLVAVDQIFARANEYGVGAGVIGMPHRGRNALLTCLLGHPIEPYLLKMRGRSEFPESLDATGDTFSHFHYAGSVKFGNQETAMDISLLPNPSHLEAVTPVAVGKARAKMLTLGDGYYSKENEETRNGDQVLCLLMHGDGSVAGQGVVAETAAIANLPNYSVGGSVHIVVDNQLGFTTEAALGRSFDYPTDLVAKGLSAPVLHVNGDNVEEVMRAGRLAVDYRQAFRRDVFINLVCYRRWGHNELDDPSLTQPLMYSRIEGLRPLPDTFAESICDAEALKEVEKETAAWSSHLQQALRGLDNYQPALVTFGGRWAAIRPAPKDHLVVSPTGVSQERLRAVGLASVSLPENFKCHPTLIRYHVERRRERVNAGTELDWATAEALAVGSLMQEGVHCRISGQDVGRGTFSNRHFMLVDQASDDVHVPLNAFLPAHLDQDGHEQARGSLEVANSALSEEAVLSFEYGYSIEDPKRLVIWEAQFGDFFNAAQVPIDTYIASAETKWQFQSGLVMLLPHGYDGAGPEHSSARIERFLQLTDSREDGVPPDGEDRNMVVVNPTTPAQYFHLLRRQLKRRWRKPLVVIAPKMILRLPQAASSLDEMAEGTFFRHVLPDPHVQSGRVDRASVRRVVLCSGKHYYALQNSRSLYEAWDTAIVRVEQLCPFPLVEIAQELRQFPNARSFVWSQEEQRNMGAWSFVRSRVEAALGVSLEYVGRRELATPAVGIDDLHKADSEAVLARTFGQAV